MEEFYKQENCGRCGTPISQTRSRERHISMFEKVCICKECKDAETLHPDYKKAVDAVRAADKAGNGEFPGIGFTPVTAKVTVEVIHRKTFDVTFDAKQWTDVCADGKVPGLDQMYAEASKAKPDADDCDYTVNTADKTIVSWDEP